MKKFPSVTVSYIDQLPKTAGVYLFYRNLIPIYIGKAINIRERVKNHFSQPSWRDNLFIDKIAKIGFFNTNSEIEALILEAKLIKKYLPKFNVVWRDDKNHFYVAIAKNKDGLPYIFITHQPNFKLRIMNYELRKNIENSKFITHKQPAGPVKFKYIGPFVEGNVLKKTLKFLRRVFPYYTTSKHSQQKCTWCHLDLCPGPNPDPKNYKDNIKKLILILQGKRKNVLSSLKKEMNFLARDKKFEEAGKARDKILALKRVMEHAHVLSNAYEIDGRQFDKYKNWGITENILKNLLQINKPISRIECYDISNIQGKHATGSMVVFEDGKPDKSQYRKFRIRMKNEPNDIAMLKEVLERRFKNTQWPYPEVMLIDGGIAQLNIAINVKNKSSIFLKAFKNILLSEKIKIISIAKGRQELFIEPARIGYAKGVAVGEQKIKPIPLKKLPQEVYNLIKRLDDEAHRFAVSYHKKLRKKALGLDME